MTSDGVKPAVQAVRLARELERKLMQVRKARRVLAALEDEARLLKRDMALWLQTADAPPGLEQVTVDEFLAQKPAGPSGG